MNKFYYFLLSVICVGIFTTSCKEDEESTASLLAGKWKKTTLDSTYAVDGVSFSDEFGDLSDLAGASGTKSLENDSLEMIIYDNFTIENYKDTVVTGSGSWSLIGKKIFTTNISGKSTSYLIEEISKSKFVISYGEDQNTYDLDSLTTTLSLIRTITYTK